MRDLIRIVENSFPDNVVVPSELYHGTSLENWQSIQETNELWGGGDHRGRIGISFTDDWAVAQRFATMNPSREGVIITFDGEKLARVAPLEPYADPGTIHSEEEWVMWDQSNIPNIADYIVSAETVTRY